MRSLILCVYVVMAGWLLISAALRVMILVGNHLPLDPLPFTSGAIALIALIAAGRVLLPGRDRVIDPTDQGFGEQDRDRR